MRDGATSDIDWVYFLMLPTVLFHSISTPSLFEQQAKTAVYSAGPSSTKHLFGIIKNFIQYYSSEIIVHESPHFNFVKSSHNSLMKKRRIFCDGAQKSNSKKRVKMHFIFSSFF